jgi:hypothetical protein
MNLEPRQDGSVLHFLKELPAWCVIGVFVGTFLVVWNISHDDFIPRIIDGLVGALLTSIVGQVRKSIPTTTNIKTDTLETPAVATDTITDSTVNTENLTVRKSNKTG